VNDPRGQSNSTRDGVKRESKKAEKRLSGRGALQRRIFVRASACGARSYGDIEKYFVAERLTRSFIWYTDRTCALWRT
jgi:hypothetical protein